MSRRRQEFALGAVAQAIPTASIACPIAAGTLVRNNANRKARLAVRIAP